MLRRARTALIALALPLASLSLAGLTTATVNAGPAAADSCPTAPAYSTGGRTYVGSNVSPGSGKNGFANAVAAKEAKFGTLQAVRTYDNGVPKSNVWTARAVLDNKVNIESFKILPQEILAGTDDAALKTFFSTAPTTMPIFWSLWHEPESEIKAGDFTAAQYRAAFQRVATIAASVCHSNLYPTLILEGYTAEAMSKRNWQDYYPGADYTSVIAFDPYNGVNVKPTSYRDPATLFAAQLAVAKAAGKPWGIAETGSALVAGDTGAARAAWLAATATWFHANNAAFVTYFDSLDHNGIGLDFQLNDTASMGAWKTAITTDMG